jgi:hypothetical protein
LKSRGKVAHQYNYCRKARDIIEEPKIHGMYLDILGSIKKGEVENIHVVKTAHQDK